MTFIVFIKYGFPITHGRGVSTEKKNDGDASSKDYAG
jgi:hypothetical protein